MHLPAWSLPGRADDMDLIRTHRRAAVLLCGLITAIGGLVIVLVLGQGSASWTGIEVAVPSCPSAAEGCRLFRHAPGRDRGRPCGLVCGRNDRRHPAAGGHLRHLRPGMRRLPDREGRGHRTVGHGIAVDLGSAWEMPKFVNRICPDLPPRRRAEARRYQRNMPLTVDAGSWVCTRSPPSAPR